MTTQLTLDMINNLSGILFSSIAFHIENIWNNARYCNFKDYILYTLKQGVQLGHFFTLNFYNSFFLQWIISESNLELMVTIKT